MNEYIKEIEEIAKKYTMSQSDGYSQIMRICEAIEYSDCWRNCENTEKCCKECEYEHEQLVKWLEELKAYREIGTVEECMNSVLDIPKAYNKGIDDFARGLDYLLVKYAIEDTLESNIENVKFSLNYIKKITSRIIEQLKAGGEND